MKHLKKLTTFFLCLALMTALGAGTAFAKTDEDESDDYSVSDVYFDVTDSAIYVGWSVGDGECKYSVQLYDSSSFKAKNKVGSASTVGYKAEILDVTQKILNKGSGTYYAVVTCKKKPKGASEYDSAYAKETIYSDELAEIRKNRKESAEASASSSSSSGTGVTGVNGGPGVSSGTGTAAGAAAASAGWQALDNGQWAYILPDGSRAVGWYEAGGKWYWSGEDGIMAASRWIPSMTEAGVYYYVDETGAMMTNATTPDGYQVDADGKWHG